MVGLGLLEGLLLVLPEADRGVRLSLDPDELPVEERDIARELLNGRGQRIDLGGEGVNVRLTLGLRCR